METQTASGPKPPWLRRLSWLFCLALTALYVSLTPGTIEGQGYNQENLVAADQVAANLIKVATGQPLGRVDWTRHGFIEPIFHVPFAIVSRALFPGPVKWIGRLAIFLPILATSLLCTLLLRWTYRLTSSRRMGVLLAVCAGLGTMLWPYAYIGLETTQSLALIVAGYLALGRPPKRNWPETLLFATACAVTVAVKLNGIFLAPAIGFLIFEYWGRTFRPRLKELSTIGIIIALYALNHLAKARYWSGLNAGTSYYRELLVDSPLTVALQVFSYFGSPNKSLLLFCPILALSFVRMGSAWRRQPRLVIFAWLTLGGLIGGFSITRMWADETWGPRYLHATIGPLLLCLAATKPDVKFQWKHEVLSLALLIWGMAVSLLGSMFPYGSLQGAAALSSQATLEAFQYDPAWNHIRFNWQMFRVWMRGHYNRTDQPALWPPTRNWWFVKPADAPLEKTVDLKTLAQPQPLWAQGWRPTMLTSPRIFTILRGLCAICLLVGLSGIGLVWRQAAAADQALSYR